MIAYISDHKDGFVDFNKPFASVGEPLQYFSASDFTELLELKDAHLISAVEAVLVDGIAQPEKVLSLSVAALRAPLVAIEADRQIDKTKKLFQLGVDDVVLKSAHPEEILLRIASVKRRMFKSHKIRGENQLVFHFDGRSPQFNDSIIDLPRKELKILEYLAICDGRRVTKRQVFDAVYGIYSEEFNDILIESHICKLRKKLRAILGYDPIDSARYLGYRIDPNCLTVERLSERANAA